MSLETMNDNILSREWERKYEEQDERGKEQIDMLRKSKPKDYQLKVIKRKRIKPESGDVFLLSPREDIYFYGKVLKANIDHIKGSNSFMHGGNVVFIFKCKNNKISMDGYKPNYDDLLIRPAVVPDTYWSQGYFYTIDNIALDEFEKQLDYGFYKMDMDEYFTATGELLEKQPKYFGGHGITTITGIAYKISFELIINPSLLEF